MKESLISAAMFEFQKEYDRKNRLDAKIIGYITFISIILAVSFSILFYIIQSKANLFIQYTSITSSALVSVFSLLIIITALTSYGTKPSAHINLNDMNELYYSNDNDKDDIIFNSYINKAKENRKSNNKLESTISIIHIQLISCLFSFIPQVLVIFIYIIIGGMYG